METKHCLVIGLNPALQRLLKMPTLQVGGVNRAASMVKDVGGKGQQVAKALQFYSLYLTFSSSASTGPNSVILVQFLGGDTGKWIEANLAQKGFQQLTVHVSSETRICTTLLCPGRNMILPSDKIRGNHRNY